MFWFTGRKQRNTPGWADAINAVKIHYGLGQSPAAVNPSTGTLFINPVMWPHLSEDQKMFIVYHELGHIKGRTTSEDRADALAHAWYTAGADGKKRTLKGTVFLMQYILPQNDPRIVRQLRRAQITDRQK